MGIGLNNVPAAMKEDDDMAGADRNAVMIGNNIAVNRVFTERLSKKYDMMYSQRAYVHCTLVKVWKKVNSLKLGKILDSWRRIILMLSRNKLLMKVMMKNSKRVP